jgi:hypothetical protein
VGGTHTSAIGYITIDVVATCNPTLPTETAYYSELLFDNVLTGDYQQVSPNPTTGNYASGESLVHIRAIPEGGAAAADVATALPYTFYDRYTPAATRRIDRRQPLPSAFVARFIQGGTSGFQTDLQIWREGVTGSETSCADWAKNSDVIAADVVRFDERENPMTLMLPTFDFGRLLLPVASRNASGGPLFPILVTGDVAGWFYFNLNNGGSTSYSAASGRDFRSNSSTTIGPRQSQNWVTLTMFAEGRFSASTDATQLANGCTPALQSHDPFFGPGPNVTP